MCSTQRGRERTRRAASVSAASAVGCARGRRVATRRASFARAWRPGRRTLHVRRCARATASTKAAGARSTRGGSSRTRSAGGAEHAQPAPRRARSRCAAWSRADARSARARASTRAEASSRARARGSSARSRGRVEERAAARPCRGAAASLETEAEARSLSPPRPRGARSTGSGRAIGERARQRILCRAAKEEMRRRPRAAAGDLRREASSLAEDRRRPPVRRRCARGGASSGRRARAAEPQGAHDVARAEAQGTGRRRRRARGPHGGVPEGATPICSAVATTCSRGRRGSARSVSRGRARDPRTPNGGCGDDGRRAESESERERGQARGDDARARRRRPPPLVVILFFNDGGACHLAANGERGSAGAARRRERRRASRRQSLATSLFGHNTCKIVGTRAEPSRDGRHGAHRATGGCAGIPSDAGRAYHAGQKAHHDGMSRTRAAAVRARGTVRSLLRPTSGLEIIRHRQVQLRSRATICICTINARRSSLHAAFPSAAIASAVTFARSSSAAISSSAQREASRPPTVCRGDAEHRGRQAILKIRSPSTSVENTELLLAFRTILVALVRNRHLTSAAMTSSAPWPRRIA